MGSLLNLKTPFQAARFTTSKGTITVDKLVMLLMAVNVFWENKHQSTK